MPTPGKSAIKQAIIGLAQRLIAKNYLLASAESCTGGLLASLCTDLPGSSQWFSHSVVSYSNLAKQRLLNVPAELINQYGAVSEQVAAAMVDGLMIDTNLIGVAITGLAGPSGATASKAVGTVCFAFKLNTQVFLYTKNFTGTRSAIRHAAVLFALMQLNILIGPTS